MTQQERKEKIMAMRRNGNNIDRHGQYWTENEREQLEKLFYTGTGITEIALTLERSETAVMQQLICCEAFRAQQRSRSGGTGQCHCSRCEQRDTCRYSPKNRESLKYTAEVEINHA